MTIQDIIKTIYFNFKYLPLYQAVKFPIYVHNAILDDMRGKILIDSPVVYHGMVSLGKWGVKIFHDKRIVWQNHGGTVIFKGKCLIGAGSSISVNAHAIVEFGEDFINSAGLKLIASRRVTFGEKARLGWNTMVMDTNMHPLKDKMTGKRGKGGAPISIGDFNWFGSNCIILPGVNTPERIICGLATIVTRNVEWEPYSLYGGSPIHKLRGNVYRDYDDDKDEEVYNMLLKTLQGD